MTENQQIAEALGWTHYCYGDLTTVKNQEGWNDADGEDMGNPDFLHDISAAWILVIHVREHFIISKRLRFLRLLQHIVSERIGGGNRVDVGYIWLHVIPKDICKAFLQVMSERSDKER